MIFQFPSLDALQLALTSDTIPSSVSLARAQGAASEEGMLWIETAQRVSRAVSAELQSLGVAVVRSAPPLAPLLCWHELAPLKKTPVPELGAQTAVLFELGDSRQLPEIVGEMIRQGNDRQGFRHLAAGNAAGNAADKGAAPGQRALLRVFGPPYYSLLRALDRAAEFPESPRAYVERAPRVWVELGWTHPLAARLAPAAGEQLLIGPGRPWMPIPEAPFRDIYESLELQLPSEASALQSVERQDAIRVPLRLAVRGGLDQPELWVLRNDPQRQVEELVSHADNRLVARLLFAVGECDGEPLVVLRVRPSRHAPPVLILDGVGYAPYQRIPNLFVPSGSRIYPPLRREAVAQLLAGDGSRLTWLHPEEGGNFRPESIADESFRPLSDWVHYVVEQSTAELDAWESTFRFEFEPFICREDDDREDRKPDKKGPREASDSRSRGAAAASEKASEKSAPKTKRKAASPEQRLAAVSQAARPSELQRQLRELEDEFQALDAPLDGPERQDLWRQMGLVNALLKNRLDGTICWSNAVWECASLPPEMAAAWLDSELRAASEGSLLSPERFEKWLAGKAPAPGSLLAAAAVQAAFGAPEGIAAHEQAARSVQVVREHSEGVPRLLEASENSLPVRTVWLGWTAVAHLHQGDTLTLARARDRLLQRLFSSGMTAEFDLPNFLRVRSTNPAENDRFRLAREHLDALHTQVRGWIQEPDGAQPRTKAYASLVFAFAYARLGQLNDAESLAESASRELADDPVHHWMRDAYRFRIQELRQGVRSPGRLAPPLLQALEAMPKMQRYLCDKLRRDSRVVEPAGRLDPYTRFHQKFATPLEEELAALRESVDHSQVAHRLTELIRSTSQGEEHPRLAVLSAAMELAPRLGEAFALPAIDLAVPAVEGAQSLVERTLLLQLSLTAAAHFGQMEAAHSLVRVLEGQLPGLLQVAVSDGGKEDVDVVFELFSHSLRGLRRLGMREEMGRIFDQLAELLEAAAQAKIKDSRRAMKRRAAVAKLQLCCAGSWYFFGQESLADRLMESAREFLLSGEAEPFEQPTLACAYIQAAANASAASLLPRILELFQETSKRRTLPNISDTLTTNSHFSLSQLRLVEAVVLALVGEDFAISQDARRMLDEEEFLVRRRMHRDMNLALGGGASPSGQL